MHEGKDRAAHLGGKVRILGLQPLQDIVAGQRGRDVQDRPDPFHRPLVKGAGGLVVQFGQKRGTDPAHGFGIDVAGHRHGIGDAPRAVPGQAAQKIGGLGHRQFRQHDGADFHGLVRQDGQQALGRQGDDAFPGVDLGRGRGHAPQARHRRLRNVPVHHAKRAFQPAGKGQAHGL